MSTESYRRDRIGAVVLAAGTSSRMGEPKQLLRLGERTVLGQTLENLRGAHVEQTVLVLGFAAETIARQTSVEGIKVVFNEHYRDGMGSSLRAGLAALNPEINGALVVLADQPFVGLATIDRLIERYLESGAQIVIPTYRGFRGNPVLLDRSVFAEVMALTGDIGCRAIFGSHTEGIVKVSVEDVGVLLDLDSPYDFERMQGFFRSQESATTVIEVADLAGREMAEPGNLSVEKDDLVLVGAEPVALALAKFGKLLGFRVTIVDPLLDITDLPDVDLVLDTLDFSHLTPGDSRYVVVASRGKFDEEAVEQGLLANASYIGLVANKNRAQEILGALEAQGETRHKLRAVHAPAGLDINAESPQEIALSIMAQIVLEKQRRSRQP
jgi:molybdenum cofactor cytidylyltransferase